MVTFHYVLFIGSTGTNHGIEIYRNIVQYARRLVKETLRRPETQCFDWAVPEFTCGNGLCLSPAHYGKYDRVYCGATVPSSHRRALWELMKIGGILVMPYDDQVMLAIMFLAVITVSSCRCYYYSGLIYNEVGEKMMLCKQIFTFCQLRKFINLCGFINIGSFSNCFLDL